MVSALESELVCTSNMSSAHQATQSPHQMIAGGFHPRQLFSNDTGGILMKRETALNRFTISVDKYHSHELKIWLIKTNLLVLFFRLMKIPAIITENGKVLFWKIINQ